MPDWDDLDRRAAARHGLLVVRDLIAEGYPRRTLYRELRRRGWVPVAPGVWAREPASTPLQRVRELQVGVDRPWPLTGGARLAVAGVRRAAPELPTLVVGRRRGGRPPAGVRLVRTGWVAGDEVQVVDGLVCAPLLRAWSDAAVEDTIDRLVRDLQVLDRLRHATPERAAEYLCRRGTFHGSRRAWAAIECVQAELVHSDAEALARGAVRSAGFRSAHPRPLLVCDRFGRRVGEIDVAFCLLRYGVEVDGPHHLDPVVAARDAARDRALQRLGWHIDRFPDIEVRADPAGFIQAVLAGAGEAAGRRARPWPCGLVH
jgi:hypothetical protein